MPQEKIALLGFGDIAARLVPHLQYALLTGVKRSVVKEAKIPFVFADCRDQASMDALMRQGFDVIVMSFTPSEISDLGYKAAYVDTVTTIVNALKKQTKQPRLIVFVSSTSVYAQTDGDWVDEASPTMPVNFSGKRLLEAESLLRQSGYIHSCIRFSGIYGATRRRLIEQVITGSGSPEEPVVYTNRIHCDDCAAVLAHIIKKQATQAIDPIYIATDCEPVPLYEVKQWMLTSLGLPEKHFSTSGTPASMFRGSKRCSNKRLLDSGYHFLYPSYREGYGPLLAK
jgi:nucleoside-diphosphate-sugar epimerase